MMMHWTELAGLLASTFDTGTSVCCILFAGVRYVNLKNLTFSQGSSLNKWNFVGTILLPLLKLELMAGHAAWHISCMRAVTITFAPKLFDQLVITYALDVALSISFPSRLRSRQFGTDWTDRQMGYHLKCDLQRPHSNKTIVVIWARWISAVVGMCYARVICIYSLARCRRSCYCCWCMQMLKMGGATGLHVTLTVVVLASLCKCAVGQGSTA